MRAGASPVIGLVVGVVIGLALLAGACASPGPAGPSATGAGGAAGSTGTFGSTAVPAGARPAETPSLRMISINLLHGIPKPVGACDEDTDFCQAPDRLALLWRMIADAGCPEIVSLQEIGFRQKELVPATASALCGGRYRIVFDDQHLFDEQLLLTTLEPASARSSEVVDLDGDFRTATLVELRSPLGPVDVLSTHIDDDLDPCRGPLCDSPLCDPTMTVGVCQVVRILDLLRTKGDPSHLTILNGDLNQRAGGDGLRLLTGAGFVDSWIASGNPECDPTTGRGCTCCVAGTDRLGGLTDPDQRFVERIDWILVKAPPTCRLGFEGPDDSNANKTTTGIFAGAPVREPIGGMVWASDHAGVQAELWCA